VIISPSLWWDDESLLELDPMAFKTTKTVYIGVGKEGEMMEKPAKRLFKLLKGSSPENPRIYFRFFEDKNHGDALHEAVYDSFEKIFKSRV
jgi:predicted alpha/beta superfamily hydrolase